MDGSLYCNRRGSDRLPQMSLMIPWVFRLMQRRTSVSCVGVALAPHQCAAVVEFIFLEFMFEVRTHLLLTSLQICMVEESLNKVMI